MQNILLGLSALMQPQTLLFLFIGTVVGLIIGARPGLTGNMAIALMVPVTFTMDPTTGLQGLSRRAFAYYGEKGHFDDKYPDANMVIQMLLLGFRVTEIPAVMHARKEGQGMHKGLQTGWYMCRMLFEIPAVIWRVRLEKRRGPAR